MNQAFSKGLSQNEEASPRSEKAAPKTSTGTLSSKDDILRTARRCRYNVRSVHGKNEIGFAI